MPDERYTEREMVKLLSENPTLKPRVKYHEEDNNFSIVPEIPPGVFGYYLPLPPFCGPVVPQTEDALAGYNRGRTGFPSIWREHNQYLGHRAPAIASGNYDGEIFNMLFSLAMPELRKADPRGAMRWN